MVAVPGSKIQTLGSFCAVITPATVKAFIPAFVDALDLSTAARVQIRFQI